jgi:iron complex transport system ATP-binding protein
MSAPAVLTARALCAAYGSEVVLGPLDLTLHGGQLLGIVGPNGAGKSTLMRALAGLIPCTGAIELLGRPLTAYARGERARTVGYLPQHPEVAWPLSLRELVALGRLPHGDCKAEPITAAIDALGLQALATRQVQTLSGGERMRAHLARLAAGEHRVLLIDEPTASLDPGYQLEVLDYLQRLTRAGAAALIVLHDLPLAARYCDALLVLAQGRVVAHGAASDLLDDALLARVFGVHGIRARLDGEERLVGISSILPTPGERATHA